MGFLETLNRFLVGCLMVLVAVQAGLLFFLKSMQDEARHRLVKNTTKIDLMCGRDQFAENMYWNIQSSEVKSQAVCENSDCQASHLLWDRPEQDGELHVISIKSAPPFRWGELTEGGAVKVNVRKSDKPQVLALISANSLEWNFEIEAGARLQKVIVASPVAAIWFNNLPEDTPIEYLPKEKMCSYPFTWEDAFNPENEFRVLISAVETVAQRKANSFQGAVIGEKFRVPLRVSNPRVLASTESARKPSSVMTDMLWRREQGHVSAEKWAESDVELPERTTRVITGPQQSLYIVKSGRLHVWNKENREFQVMMTPMSLPDAGDVTALALDPRDQSLFVYNDQRGGELFKFEPNTKTWSVLRRGFNYFFQAMMFDKDTKELVGVVSRGTYLVKVVYMDEAGKELRVQELNNKFALDKKRWHWELAKDHGALYLQVHTPAQPQGSRYAIE